MIDFPRFHTDTVISSELELLLEGLLLTIESASSSTQILVPKTEPPISQPTKPSSSESTTSGHTISDAKSAFMNELTGWDLPPRL
mgnify:FL=1